MAHPLITKSLFSIMPTDMTSEQSVDQATVFFQELNKDLDKQVHAIKYFLKTGRDLGLLRNIPDDKTIDKFCELYKQNDNSAVDFAKQLNCMDMRIFAAGKGNFIYTLTGFVSIPDIDPDAVPDPIVYQKPAATQPSKAQEVPPVEQKAAEIGPQKGVNLQAIANYLNAHLDFYGMSAEAKLYRERNPEQGAFKNWTVEDGRLFYSMPGTRYRERAPNYNTVMRDGLYSQLQKDFGITSAEELANRVQQSGLSISGHGGPSPAALFLYMEREVKGANLDQATKTKMLDVFKGFCENVSKGKSEGNFNFGKMGDAAIIREEDVAVLQQLSLLSNAPVKRAEVSPVQVEKRGVDEKAPGENALTFAFAKDLRERARAMADQGDLQGAFRLFVTEIAPKDKPNGLITGDKPLNTDMINKIFDFNKRYLNAQKEGERTGNYQGFFDIREEMNSFVKSQGNYFNDGLVRLLYATKDYEFNIALKRLNIDVLPGPGLGVAAKASAPSAKEVVDKLNSLSQEMAIWEVKGGDVVFPGYPQDAVDLLKQKFPNATFKVNDAESTLTLDKSAFQQIISPVAEVKAGIPAAEVKAVKVDKAAEADKLGKGAAKNAAFRKLSDFIENSESPFKEKYQQILNDYGKKLNSDIANTEFDNKLPLEMLLDVAAVFQQQHNIANLSGTLFYTYSDHVVANIFSKCRNESLSELQALPQSKKEFLARLMQPRDRDTLLFEAVQSSNPNLLKFCLELKADVNHQASGGSNILQENSRFVDKANATIQTMLLAAGARGLNQQDFHSTPIIQLCHRLDKNSWPVDLPTQRARIIELLEAKADINVHEAWGGEKRTPLMLACRYDSVLAQQFVTKYKADVMAVDAHGKTALDYATDPGLKQLLETTMRAVAGKVDKPAAPVQTDASLNKASIIKEYLTGIKLNRNADGTFTSRSNLYNLTCDIIQGSPNLDLLDKLKPLNLTFDQLNEKKNPRAYELNDAFRNITVKQLEMFAKHLADTYQIQDKVIEQVTQARMEAKQKPTAPVQATEVKQTPPPSYQSALGDPVLTTKQKYPVPTTAAPGTLTLTYAQGVRDEALKFAEQKGPNEREQLATAVKYFIDRILPLDQSRKGILTDPKGKVDLDATVVNHLIDLFRQGKDDQIKTFGRDTPNYSSVTKLLGAAKTVAEFKSYLTGDLEKSFKSLPLKKPEVGQPAQEAPAQRITKGAP